MKLPVAILSAAIGSYHKLRSQSTHAYQFDYQMKPWNYNWDNQDECQNPKKFENSKSKNIFLISQFSEINGCTPRTQQLVQTVAKRLHQLSDGLSDQVTVFPFSEGYGCKEFKRAVRQAFDTKTPKFHTKFEFDLEGDLMYQDPPIYTDNSGSKIREAKAMMNHPKMQKAFEANFKRSLKDCRETEIYVLPPKVIQFVTLKLMQLDTKFWPRFLFRKASITWIQLNSNGTVILRCMDDCSYDEQQRDAFYTEDVTAQQKPSVCSPKPNIRLV